MFSYRLHRTELKLFTFIEWKIHFIHTKGYQKILCNKKREKKKKNYEFDV